MSNLSAIIRKHENQWKQGMAVDSLAKRKAIIVCGNRLQCNRGEKFISIEEPRKINKHMVYTFTYTFIIL